MTTNKTWKWLGAIFLIALLAGSMAAYKIWNKPARDVKKEVGISVTAQGIFDSYTNEEKKSDSLYLDKAIEVNGVISELSKTETGKQIIILQTSDPISGVRCTMKDSAVAKAGQNVRIKGFCKGFLMDVTLTECYLIK